MLLLDQHSQILDGTVGPFDEGVSVCFACESEGGELHTIPFTQCTIAMHKEPIVFSTKLCISPHAVPIDAQECLF